MRLLFLGTGAATSVPLAFCSCPTCTAARAQGGKDLRRRAALLVNDDLLIDFGPDTVQASFAFGADLMRVRYWLQTHAHDDHFDSAHLITRSPDYGAQGVPPLTLYAAPRCIAHMSYMLNENEEGASLEDPAFLSRLRLTVVPAVTGAPQRLGRYTVWAVPSAHDPEAGSVIFAVSDGEAALLYATDTADFTEPVWAALHETGLRFSCAALDHTVGGDCATCPTHLNAVQVRRIVAGLRQRGLAAADCRFFATHLSHEENPPHETLRREAAPYGYDVAYDGLTLDI